MLEAIIYLSIGLCLISAFVFFVKHAKRLLLTKKEAVIKIKKVLPEIILIIGTSLIAIRLFFPPMYIVFGGNRLKVPTKLFGWKVKDIYPVSDFNTAILHSLGIALITGVLFYLFKKRARH